MKQKITIVRSQMFVEGEGAKVGVAWVEQHRFRKRKPMRWKQRIMGSDGVIRVKRNVSFIKEMIAGDCSWCKQFPCGHTAKLMGWTK